MSEKQEKKVVGRNIAIALGIICIILAVGLVGAVANYTSIISGKDSTIASLNSQITVKDSQISSLNSNNNILQNLMNGLNGIVNLTRSDTWVNSETISQPSSSYWSFSTNAVIYAGYVSVWVQTSTTTNTYVRVIYTAYGVNYDNQIVVGTSGTAVFPLLPSSSIEIRVGNSNWINGATETVTITYHY